MRFFLFILSLTLTVGAATVSVLDAPAPALAVTSGETLKLRLVSPSLPLTKDNVRLFQRGNNAAMPLPLTVSVEPENNGVIFNVSVTLPVTNKLTAVLLTAGNLTLPLTIYPVENKKSTGYLISEKLKNGKIKWLAVIDDGAGDSAITQFFNLRGVEFFTGDRITPNSLAFMRLTASDIKNLPSSYTEQSNIIVFVSDSHDTPGIYTKLSTDGIFTKVTLPVLDDLETNPRSREIFLNLINQQLSRDMAVEN